MRVLFVPSGTERIAAARYRAYQYGPCLAAHGIEPRVFSAVSDFTTRLMLAAPDLSAIGKRLYYGWVVAERLVRFVPILFMARGYDAVYLQRSTFFGMEWLLKKSCRTLLFDFDDAIFMADPSDGEGSRLRHLKDALKSFELEHVLRASERVVVENQYLRRYAERQGATVTIIAGPIDTDHFVPGPRRGGGPLTIGWIGSRSTLPYLGALHRVLERLAGEFDVRLKVIGAGHYEVPGIRTVSVPWSLATELAELQSFDVGVMPMPNDAWTLGKLGCKMLLYMAVGVPPVVGYTDTNAEVIVDGENGYLVHDEEGWYERLSALLRDALLRERLGRAARSTIERTCSLRVGGERLVALLHDAVAAS